jgi:SAM-dependent methyltransferase
VTAALDVYALALDDPTALQRWLGPTTAVDERVLDRAEGPVLDVGCGPGRHVGSLARRGVLAVGVDVLPHAIRLARRRGALVLERSIFDHLPGAGEWGSALLLDGNIGIGGRPVPLLARVAALLRPRGAVIVELEPPGGGVRVVDWFDWARVAVDAVEELADDAGLTVEERWRDGERWFGMLRRP